MAQLKIDLTTGDLAVENGGFVVATGLQEIAQHVWLRLGIILGELVLATDRGLPFHGELTEKGTPIQRLAAIYRETILGTPGVVSILEPGVLLTQDPATRKVTVQFSADTDEGLLVFNAPIPVIQLPEAA